MMKIELENLPENVLLTCIIPLRVAHERLDAIERLEFSRLDTSLPETVGFLVVDDGSDILESNLIQEKCRQLDFGYLRIDSQLREFSVGRCRNVGAMYAQSQFVLMQDVDLMPCPGFFNSLLKEIEIQEFYEDSKKFLMVPYVFLSEAGTEAFLSADPFIRVQKFLHAAWLNSSELIEKVSTGTSANLYNREWYLARGGNSPDFEGWGYEDLECNTRLIRHLNYFPTPQDWQVQKFNFNSVLEYSTWKSVYRLFGDMLFVKGIAFFHAWHPVHEGGTYMQRKNFNRALFERKMREFITNRYEPEALVDMSRGRSLVLRRNAFTFSRTIQPLWGEIVDPSTELLEGGVSLAAFVQSEQIDRVVFHNPYLDERILALYKEAKELGLKFLVCERGALPGSLFFDPSGFLVDGRTYSSELWDLPISEASRARAAAYIRSLQNSEESLERQTARIGRDALRRALKVRSGEKILVVIFQRPGDTVTRYFQSDLGDYERFVEVVRDLSHRMPVGWRMVAKRHPLEDEDFALSDSVANAGNANIRDLLDLGDALLTFNSGVGVMALAWGVPTLLGGGAFYAHPSLNMTFKGVSEIHKFLKSPACPDPEIVLRFYAYLIERVYSFGEFETKMVKMPDGSNMTATMDVKFRELRLPGEPVRLFSDNKSAAVGWESFLFDRYRFERTNRKANQEVAKGGLQGDCRTFHSNSQRKSGSFFRKINKLFREPRRFLEDSRFGVLRGVGAKIK